MKKRTRVRVSSFLFFFFFFFWPRRLIPLFAIFSATKPDLRNGTAHLQRDLERLLKSFSLEQVSYGTRHRIHPFGLPRAQVPNVVRALLDILAAPQTQGHHSLCVRAKKRRVNSALSPFTNENERSNAWRVRDTDGSKRKSRRKHTGIWKSRSLERLWKFWITKVWDWEIGNLGRERERERDVGTSNVPKVCALGELE